MGVLRLKRCKSVVFVWVVRYIFASVRFVAGSIDRRLNRGTCGAVSYTHLDVYKRQRNNSYYLTHDFAKNKSTAGTIFLDEHHPMTEKTQNLLLHGHNMKDGTMFGRLTQYEKSIDYLKAHPFVDFSTLWHQERYVIFAVVDVSLDTSSENFLDYFAHPRFSSDAEFASYIRRAELALSLIHISANRRSAWSAFHPARYPARRRCGAERP